MYATALHLTRQHKPFKICVDYSYDEITGIYRGLASALAKVVNLIRVIPNLIVEIIIMGGYVKEKNGTPNLEELDRITAYSLKVIKSLETFKDENKHFSPSVGVNPHKGNYIIHLPIIRL